ncbi:hypothetical protein BH11BAC6_BH11BAC6_01020 [soil metagenome]
MKKILRLLKTTPIKHLFICLGLICLQTFNASSQTLIFRVVTDSTWKSSNNPGTGWEQPGYDDSGWPYAVNLGHDSALLQFSPSPIRIWNAVTLSPNTTYLRRQFSLNGTISHVTMDYSVDDDAQIYINGQLVTSDNDCIANGHVGYDVTSYLNLNGNNTIAVKASDCGGAWTFAAQLYEYSNRLLVTDKTWKSSNTPGTGWEQIGYDDSNWPAADSLAPDGGILQFNPPPTGIWNTVITSPNITYFRKNFTLNNVTGFVTMDYSVDDDAQIYINGQFVTADNDCLANSHFNLDVTPYLNLNGSNTIAARASDCGGGWFFSTQLYQTAPTVPAVSIGNKSITEGNIGTSTMKFKVTLNTAYSGTLSVKYATADNTATAVSDYVAANGKLSFKPGQTSKTISILINGDTQVESNEKFNVVLSTPVNVSIAGSGIGIGTIKNDDAASFTANNNIDNAAIKTSTNLKASPNPAKDQITVLGLAAGPTNYIELTDLNGRSLLKKKVNGSNETINISSYSSGIYILRYFDGNKMQQLKVIKE